MPHRFSITLLAVVLSGCVSAHQPVATTNVSPSPEAGAHVDRIASFRAIRPIGGRVYLATEISRSKDFTCAVSLNGESWTDACVARVGDVVHTGSPDVIGAGGCWYDVLEIADDHVVLRENTTFYDVVPDAHAVMRVARYGDASGAQEAAADIRRGHLAVRCYGLGTRYEYTALRDRYGVSVDRVAGCVVDEQLVAAADAYNTVMIAEFERRFGKGILDRLRDEGQQRVYAEWQEQQAAGAAKK